MKKTLTLLLSIVVLLSSCAKDDLNDIRSRLDNLEAWQKSVNSDITTLKTLVETLNGKDFVTSVEPLADGSGYVINFKNSGAVTIKHGTDGTDGTDGATPAIGTKKHTDDQYYWTIDGEWMLDSSSNKLPVTGENGADAVSPKMRINSESNMWEVSTDSGSTWISTGVKATGENGADGDSFFKSVDDTNPLYVVITLTDGTVMNLPKMPKVTVGFDSYEAFNFSFGNLLEQENFIMLNFPTTLKKSDFTAMSTTLKHSTGEITDIVTRAIEPTTTNWGVDLVEPSFKTDGTIDTDHISYVKLTPPTNNASIKDGEVFILEVSVINAEGQTYTISRPVKFSKSITATDAGSLASIFETGDYAAHYQAATNITIKGDINSGDFTALKSLITNHNLTHLDLSDVVVVGAIGISYTADGGWVFQEGNAIPGWAFADSKIKEIILPNSITKIGDRAFQGCATLTKINLGSGVEEIGNSVFYNAAKLASIEIPANVRTLGRWVFEGCSTLATITLNEGLTTLLSSAFYGCTGLESITIPESVTTIGKYVFAECPSLTEAIIKSQIEEIPGAMFSNSTNLSNVTLPSTIKIIGGTAFSNTGLVDFVIPNGITTLGEGAFSECKKLKTLTIPGTVQSMLWGVFAYNPLLETVTIEEGVSSIDAEAFRDCVKLNNVVLPSTITQIRDRAFQGCAGFTSLTCKATTPPSLIEHNTNENLNLHFYGIKQSLTLYVPAGSESSYTTNWVPQFKSIVGDNSVTVVTIRE